jgi:hypothetical protein
MPRLSARQARACDVVKTFLDHHTTQIKQALRRRNKLTRIFARAGFTAQEIEELTSPGPLAADMDTVPATLMSDSESDSHTTASSVSTGDSDISSVSDSSSSSDNWSDTLGSDWRSTSSGSSSSSASTTFESSSWDGDDEMPELHLVGYPDSDEEDESTSSSESSSDGSNDATEEDMEVDSPDVADLPLPHNNPLRWARHNLEQMYGQRYENSRDTFPRGPAFLPHVLGVMKNTRPDLFRQELRVSPLTFDKLVDRIANDAVFSNDSQNAQMPVESQLAIALFRFGHSGNAAGLQKVANWAGVGKGTVTVVMRRVMIAILRPDFMAEAVRMPTAPEKDKAKAWVQNHSCKAWRDGWCMVDGTLVVLFDRPFWFGESYFDCKCNYSLNIQVCTSQFVCYIYVLIVNL